MILLKTNTVEERSVTDYHGSVLGQATVAASIARGLFVSVTDAIRQRWGAYTSIQKSAPADWFCKPKVPKIEAQPMDLTRRIAN